MQSVIYEKWSEKSNLSICTIFMHDQTSWIDVSSRTRKSTLKGHIWIWNLNLWFKFVQTLLVLSCISPTHSYCHVSCMHHIVAHCLVMVVYRCPLRQVLSLRSIVITLTKNRISASNHQASNQPFDHIDTIPCSRSCSLLLH